MITTIMIAAAAGVPCAIAGFALGRLTGLAGLRNELNALDAENMGLAGKLARLKIDHAVVTERYAKLTDRDAKGRFVKREKAADAIRTAALHERMRRSLAKVEVA